MGKGKLEKFAEVSAFENTLELTDFQEDESQKPKGRWQSEIFNNDNPIVAELACGKGTYTLELARCNPDKNFIGIDIKGARIWKGARQALDEGLENVRFMRMYIDHLDEYFAPGEIDEVWITFPDPFPRKSDESNRLTSSKFLSIYQKVLRSGAPIHFKTDSDTFFDYSLESIEKFGCTVNKVIRDIHNQESVDKLITIKTHFEKRHIEHSKRIDYLNFTLPFTNQ